VALQTRLGREAAARRAEPWSWADGARVGACFLAYAPGEAGPGGPGDRAWAAAVVVAGGLGPRLAEHVVAGAVGAAYHPGLLALREGPLLAEAVRGLPVRPDVVMVDATGADHPRRAGLAVHLGAALDVPSVGVTHRTLVARGAPPGPARGDTAPLVADGEVVAAWVRTRAGAHPVAAHAGWRTDVATAVAVVLASSDGRARTPGPLREARRLARTARAAGVPLG